MAFPNPLYVQKTDETYLKIDGAKYRASVVLETYKDGTTYRNDPVGILNAKTEAANGSALAAYALYSDLMGGVVNMGTGAPAAGTPVAPRKLERERHQYQYLDSRPFTVSCTTVNGDNTLTVPDSTVMIVGMQISGTGIATGAVILSITDATHIEMSLPATSGATNNISFTGNIVGACWVDDWVGESGNIPGYL